MAAPILRKPVGGIIAATITPAGNLLRAAMAADGRIEATFRNEALLKELPLIEQRSSYVELSDADAGPQRVRHILNLVISRQAGQTHLNPEFRRTATTEGLIAVVTAASGEQLLVGWSVRLGSEQPLRLQSIRNESGTKPLDGTPAILTLASEDIDAATELKEQEP